MIELRLESGRTLRMSYGHPAADGRAFGEFGAGDFIDGVRVLEKRAVSYEQPFTYDILPASDSGTYFAAGVLVGSTLAEHSSSSLLSLPASAPVSSSPR